MPRRTPLVVLAVLVVMALLVGACGSSTPSSVTPSGGASSTEEPEVTVDPNATLEPEVTFDPNATEEPLASDAFDTDDPNATENPNATEVPLPSDDPNATEDPNATDEPAAGGGVEMKIVITGGDYAGTYQGTDDTGGCVFGTDGTADDFALTAALSDASDPGEPTKNFGLGVNLPDRQAGIGGTTSLSLVLGLGDADAQIDYVIDTIDPRDSKGSGTARIVVTDTTVVLTASGDAQLETINGPGDPSKIEITATCLDIAGP